MTTSQHFSPNFSISEIEKSIVKTLDDSLVKFIYRDCYGRSRGRVDRFLQQVETLPDMGNSTMDRIFSGINKEEFEEYLKFYYVLYYRSLSMSSAEQTYKVPDFYKFLRHVVNNTVKDIMVNGLTFTRLRDHQWIPTLYQIVDKSIEKSFRTCAKMRDVLSKNMSILSTPPAPPPAPAAEPPRPISPVASITQMPGPVLPTLTEATMEDVPEEAEGSEHHSEPADQEVVEEAEPDEGDEPEEEEEEEQPEEQQELENIDNETVEEVPHANDDSTVKTIELPSKAEKPRKIVEP